MLMTGHWQFLKVYREINNFIILKTSNLAVELHTPAA